MTKKRRGKKKFSQESAAPWECRARPRTDSFLERVCVCAHVHDAAQSITGTSRLRLFERLSHERPDTRRRAFPIVCHVHAHMHAHIPGPSSISGLQSPSLSPAPSPPPGAPDSVFGSRLGAGGLLVLTAGPPRCALMQHAPPLRALYVPFSLCPPPLPTRSHPPTSAHHPHCFKNPISLRTSAQTD